jgi:hypothetical protein
VQDVVHRKRGGKVAVVEVFVRREGAEQRVERLAAAGHRQRQEVVDEQAAGVAPVSACLSVLDGCDDIAVLFMPYRRSAVQRPDRCRRDVPELEPQQIGEEVVVAKPRSGRVERRDERILGFEPQEDRLSAGPAGERVRKRPLTRSGIDVRRSRLRTSGG